MFYYLDGRVTSTVATLEGRTLKKVQVPDPSTGYKSTEEVCAIYRLVQKCCIIYKGRIFDIDSLETEIR